MTRKLHYSDLMTIGELWYDSTPAAPCDSSSKRGNMKEMEWNKQGDGERKDETWNEKGRKERPNKGIGDDVQKFAMKARNFPQGATSAISHSYWVANGGIYSIGSQIHH